MEIVFIAGVPNIADKVKFTLAFALVLIGFILICEVLRRLIKLFFKSPPA